jgi:FkbM family methyltransferase
MCEIMMLAMLMGCAAFSPNVVVPDHCVPMVRRLFTKQRSFNMVNTTSTRRMNTASVVAHACHRATDTNDRAADPAQCSMAVDMVSSKFVVPGKLFSTGVGDTLLEMLPSPDELERPRIIDIGCGLAVYHRNISAWYRHRSEHVLVDQSLDEVHVGTTVRRWNGYSSSPFNFYNSMECARDTLVSSGVPAAHIKLVNASADALVKAVDPGSVDVAISLFSMGYHYSTRLYASALATVLKPKMGRLFVTIARWAAVDHQASSLAEVGFTCTTTGVGFMRCCLGCAKASLSHAQGRTAEEIFAALDKVTNNASVCDNPGRISRMSSNGRWPHLQKHQLLFSHGMPHHLVTIEPLSVNAFTSAIALAPSQITVLDIGSNVGAYAVFAGLLGANVVAVDMQPKCVQMAACNMRANNIDADLQLGYVAPDHVSRYIHVPDDDCNVMASPTAVAGRYPHGLLQKKSRVIYGTDNRTHILSPNMRLIDVPPLHVGSYLARKRGLAPVAVVKIDTEGYEIAVLEALRPIWEMLDDVILELQPRSWHYANVTLEHGLATLHELMRTRDFVVVTMPHAERQDASSAIAKWNACKVPFLPSAKRLDHEFAPHKGIDSSRRFGFPGLKHYVNHIYSSPNRHGWFHEILLTNRCATGKDAIQVVFEERRSKE